jgi:hypothetical protein
VDDSARPRLLMAQCRVDEKSRVVSNPVQTRTVDRSQPHRYRAPPKLPPRLERLLLADRPGVYSVMSTVPNMGLYPARVASLAGFFLDGREAGHERHGGLAKRGLVPQNHRNMTVPDLARRSNRELSGSRLCRV